MRHRESDKHLPRYVYRHHGAFYYVKDKKWTRLGITLQDALAAYARLHEPTSSGGMSALIDEAINAVAPHLKPNTARQYRGAAKKLKVILKDFSPGQVKPKHIAKIKKQMADKPNMANRYLSVLRTVFNYALENEMVDSNPAVGIKPHKERKRRRHITPAEYAAIYVEAGARLQVIMDLASLTGQRIGDVLSIRRSDLADDGIRFRQQKTDEPLTIRWNPALRAVVERAKTLHKVPALTLLRNRMGKAPDYRTIRDQWADACKAAGVADAHLHDLRARAITQAKKEGLNPTALAGHRTEAQTVRYIRDHDEPLVDGPEFLPPLEVARKGTDESRG